MHATPAEGRQGPLRTSVIELEPERVPHGLPLPPAARTVSALVARGLIELADLVTAGAPLAERVRTTFAGPFGHALQYTEFRLT
jgi:hypothetical protein